PAAAAPASDRAREKEFLAKNGAALRDYEQRLGKISKRYYKNHPIAREVDSAFANLPRYMAVLHRYQRDRDLYQWARDTAALPEVRATIKQFLSRPEAWVAAAQMATEVLKQQPPPAPIYQEVTRFLNHDPAMLEMTAKVMSDAQPNLTTGVAALAGQDLAPLEGVIKDLSLAKVGAR
ncbi:MAG: hypothetical protein PHU21_13975, partial [Elusimicrobia bacterium]|nr:hypothetical protein [Elusimicrobiota bacterium]